MVMFTLFLLDESFNYIDEMFQSLVLGNYKRSSQSDLFLEK